jgi:hypothetical protein
MTLKPSGQACKALLVPGVLALAFGGIAFALDRFDRGFGDIRALCLLTLGIVASVLQYSPTPATRTVGSDRHVLWLSLVVLLVLGTSTIL